MTHDHPSSPPIKYRGQMVTLEFKHRHRFIVYQDGREEVIPADKSPHWDPNTGEWVLREH